MASRMVVISGSVAWFSLKILVIFGTTYDSRKKRIAAADDCPSRPGR